MSVVNYPIHTVCRGFDPDSVIAGGGGGTSKAGVPNCFQIFSIRNGTLTHEEPILTDNCVTGLASYSNQDTKYLAVAVGPEIRLLDSSFAPIAKFDTHMEKFIFRGLTFSPDGTFLIAVDGDDRLRLFELPSLKELHTRPATRATFFREMVAFTVNDDVLLSEPTKEFTEIAAARGLGLTPRALQSDGESLFYAEYGPDRKPVPLCFAVALKVISRRVPQRASSRA